MMRHTVTLHVPTQINRDGDTVTESVYVLKRCCMQFTSFNAIGKTAVDVQKTATLFIDSRLTAPHIDLNVLKAVADSAGGTMTVTYDGSDYAVIGVSTMLDNVAHIHHYEVALK